MTRRSTRSASPRPIIGTRMTTDALAAGKHVYCEKPMTHTIEEALQVHKAWKQSGLVMQVGVQSTEVPAWHDARRRICDGQLGKVLQYQTEFFRNSAWASGVTTSSHAT